MNLQTSPTITSETAVACLFDLAIRRFGARDARRVLDFGCGAGALVDGLIAKGYEAYGCDFAAVVGGTSRERIRQIDTSSGYSLPFADELFDVVVSTSVLEHAQNKRQCLKEIRRVLKPEGISLHLFPAKKFLPIEPHVHVPLVNWVWPRCPRWWFSLWALLGIRNTAQKDLTWREVAARNLEYFASGLSYWPTSKIEQVALEIFGSCEWPMRFYLDHSPGRYARCIRKLPFKSFWDILSREFRYCFLLTRKSA